MLQSIKNNSVSLESQRLKASPSNRGLMLKQSAIIILQRQFDFYQLLLLGLLSYDTVRMKILVLYLLKLRMERQPMFIQAFRHS